MRRKNELKKHGLPVILTALILTFGCMGVVHAEIVEPYSPGQQIGYPAVVLCEKLSFKDAPGLYSNVIQTLNYGDMPIVIGADQPSGPQEEDGFVYCTLSDSEDSPCGWINSSYIVINPAWYVTETDTPVYAWNDLAAPSVGLLDKGTRYPILKEEGDWYVISLRGAAGWIHK